VQGEALDIEDNISNVHRNTVQVGTRVGDGD
jgi:hypothetical protein